MDIKKKAKKNTEKKSKNPPDNAGDLLDAGVTTLECIAVLFECFG
jgi:hypothetical protein